MARPKRVFSNEIVQRIEALALEGCQNKTIANILDVPNNTLIRRFSKLLMKKRSERRYNLRQKQNKLADSNPAMAIFLGKNELNQADKQVIETHVPIKDRTEAELKAAQAAAQAYKLRLTRESRSEAVG